MLCGILAENYLYGIEWGFCAGDLPLKTKSNRPLAFGRRHIARLSPVLNTLRRRRIRELLIKGYRLWRRVGWSGVWNWLFVATSYRQWVKTYDTLTEADRETVRSEVRSLKYKPLISVLMLVENVSEVELRRAINSIFRQLYPHWELCIACNALAESRTAEVLNEYAQNDERIQVSFQNGGSRVSALANASLQMANGDFSAILDQGNELSPHALFMVAMALNEDGQVKLIYSDEDKVDGRGRRYDPYFKPEWDPVLMLGQNLVGQFAVFSSALARNVGGFREECGSACEWDFALRISERLEGDCIRHIPHVLCHQGSSSVDKGLSGGEEPRGERIAALLKDCCIRRGIHADVCIADDGRIGLTYHLPQPPPLVSIVIPTYNGLALLKGCLDGLFGNTDYPSLEIVVVDNRSDDPETLDYLASLCDSGQISVIRYDEPFNFSAINNYAIERVNGEIVCLLNNDVEPVSAGWLSEMVGHALRPEVGVVGAMLYYPDETIQHGGVFLNGHGADHLYKGCKRGFGGNGGRARLVQTVSAVTAACMVMRKEVWDEVGGMDEDRLAVAFNDVDLCLKVRGRGYRNIWTPFAELYHHESVSRGKDDTPEKRARFEREIACLRERWEPELESDPAINPNQSLARPWEQFAVPPRTSDCILWRSK